MAGASARSAAELITEHEVAVWKVTAGHPEEIRLLAEE